MPRPQKVPQYDSMVTEAIAAGRQEGATLHQICSYIASWPATMTKRTIPH